jgi:acyl-CoA reductase-like NAD-dependent aldehyde dehydrogenase
MHLPAKSLIYPEPAGVVLILAPWNYPFQLTFAPLIGAIAAGNCAVLKPSEYAPHMSAAIAEIIRNGFEEHYITVTEGGVEVSKALLQEKFDHIFFTGSTTVGKLVMRAASQHLTPVTLELGGKSPCIVWKDANIEVTSRRILWGKFMNAGQTCVAPDFLLVHKDIREGLIEALINGIGKFYGPSPQQSKDYARIINENHFERLIKYLGDGTVLFGGEHDKKDLYISPTLLSNVEQSSPVMQDEIFGPILPIIEFETMEDVIDRIRSKPKPLSLYLFTDDKSVQEAILRNTSSGGVCVNDTVSHIVGSDLPFGGVGESGFGSYHGKASFDSFTHYKSVLKRSFSFDARMKYPPYQVELKKIKRILKFLLR